VDKVDAGTKLVNAAGRTMEEIVISVKKVSDLIAEIAAASQEQSAGLGHVNTAVAQMEQVVQQNASLVEEATAATESMKEQAGTLLRLVSRFNVGEAPSMQAQGPRPAIVAPVPLRTSHALPPAYAPALSATGSRAPRAAGAWQEF
jgi:ABC-type transporter Mla subunit MlaD